MSFFLLWGFGLWLEATLALRVAGQFFFNLETLLLTFALTVPLIAIATYPVYPARKLAPSERLVAAVYMVLPGMLLDVLSVLFFPLVFPNLPQSDTTILLLFC
jgi:hypothetical protein